MSEVLRGIRAFFSGFKFIATTPAIWGYAAVPVTMALLLTTGFMVAGVWGAGAAASAIFGEPTGELGEAGLFATRILFYVLATVMAVLGGMALAQPLSGPALDRIVRAEEESLGGGTWPDSRFGESLGRSFRVTLTTLAIGVPILILLTGLELLFPPVAVVTMPLKFGVSALLATWDLIDYPFSLRGIDVQARYTWLKGNLGAAFGFGAMIALVALVPFLGLLMLPVGVAGATKLIFVRQVLGNPGAGGADVRQR